MLERRDQPFTHWIDPTFLDDPEAVAAEFPPPGDPRWHVFRAAHENGKGQYPGSFGPFTSDLLGRLRGSSFVSELETVTGITPLDPDVLGGGMHQTEVGGHLDVHVDFNEHPHRPGWRRALNLLVYLNDCEGGELELWDGSEARAVIPPKAGTAVLFPTSDSSWHGHPNPTRTVRRSVAVYYFTPGSVTRPHSTEWLNAH